MRRALLFTIGILVASQSGANSIEVTSASPVISPYSYWPTNPRSGRFYRPTGVRVGNEYFLYVQGGAYAGVYDGPGSECSLGEEVLLFKAPWSASALRSPFTYVRTVNPCKTSAPNVHYQSGSAFVSSTDGKVKLLIDETENGAEPREGDFKRVLLGSSPDGRTFSWTTFLKQSIVNGRTYSIDDVILVQATANSNWWGVFRWAWCDRCDGTDGSDFLQQGRIRVVMNAAAPRGFDVYLLEQSSGQWAKTNDDGSFNFVPYVTFQKWGVRSIVLNNGAWEAWRDDWGTPNGGCDDGDPNSSSTFGYQPVTQAGGWGADQTVSSTSRPMPSANMYGRLSPWRLQDMNGSRLLYSASADRMCSEGRLEGFRGMEILVSQVSN